jgi:hypothetical protein
MKSIYKNKSNIESNLLDLYSTHSLDVYAKTLNKKNRFLKFLAILAPILIIVFVVLYLNFDQNDESTFSDYVNATQASATTKLLTSTSAEVVGRDNLEYGEDCDPSNDKFCNEIENLECSINLKCDCKKDWYHNKSLCGKVIILI